MLRRAGLAGSIVGIDLAEALQTAHALGAIDDIALVEYLTAIEIAAVVKSLEQAKAKGSA